jgi:multidrug resistance efflux pump
MDRIRTKSGSLSWKRPALIAAALVTMMIAGVTLASIDFRTRRVDRTSLTVDTVRRGAMEVKVAANGLLIARHVEHLASQVTGRVARTNVKPGALVKAGDVLVELTNPQLTAVADEAQSAWEGARAELQAAQSDLQTNLLDQEVVLTQARFNAEKAHAKLDADTALSRNGLISDVELRRSRLDASQLDRTSEIETTRLQQLRNNIGVQVMVKRARVDQLARALERARSEAAQLKIVAGISGIVQSIQVEVGEQLQPGSGVGLIAQQDALYAELRVPAREATQVATGQSVVVDTRNGTVEGIVARVDPGVTDGTVAVDIDLHDPLPGGARPQLPVEGVIYVTRLAGTLFVGKPAYVKSDADVAVYKLDPAGRYAMRTTIRAGRISLTDLQVLGGLQAGDRIITSEIGEWQGQDRILLQ